MSSGYDRYELYQEELEHNAIVKAQYEAGRCGLSLCARCNDVCLDRDGDVGCEITHQIKPDKSHCPKVLESLGEAILKNEKCAGCSSNGAYDECNPFPDGRARAECGECEYLSVEREFGNMRVLCERSECIKDVIAYNQIIESIRIVGEQNQKVS